MSDYLCTTCGHIGQPKTITKGRTGIELILWLAFIIPGLIYSIWRLSSRYEACKICGNKTLIPVESPVAKSFIKTHGLESNDKEKAPNPIRAPLPIAVVTGKMVGRATRKIIGK